MTADKKHLEEVAAFIRECRSNEASFEKLYARLSEESENTDGSSSYTNALKEVKEKAAVEYKKAKEQGGSAWPEFEKFVTGFEITVTGALREMD